MSDFFNPKEDILEVELTPYGVEKMKDGHLNPCYYTFHDDEVYYGDGETDSLYNELKKDNYNRIYKDSCYIRNFKNRNQKEQSFYENNSPLGTAKPGTPWASSFELNIYDPKIKIGDSSVTLENETHEPQAILDRPNARTIDNIYTIDLDVINYTIEAKELRDYDIETIEENLDEVLGDYSSEIFPDQTFIKIDAPDFIFSLDELNVADEFENFDIELFVEEEAYFSEVIQDPKYEENTIVNDLLVEGDNSRHIEEFRIKHSAKATSSDLFLLEVDEEIPSDVLEKYFNNEKANTTTDNTLPQNPAAVYSDTLSGPFGDDCE